ncbi:MAG: hypothetical protein M3M87_05030 [Thermoproteota archaeon]|nr:hypothetical protein [Thermoproteota archaeon]
MKLRQKPLYENKKWRENGERRLNTKYAPSSREYVLDTEFDLNARQNEEIWIKMKQWLMQLNNQDV